MSSCHIDVRYLCYYYFTNQCPWDMRYNTNCYKRLGLTLIVIYGFQMFKMIGIMIFARQPHIVWHGWYTLVTLYTFWRVWVYFVVVFVPKGFTHGTLSLYIENSGEFQYVDLSITWASQWSALCVRNHVRRVRGPDPLKIKGICRF